MRLSWLTGTVAVLVAGCASVQTPTAKADAKADAGQAPHQHGPSATPAIHPHTHLDSIPAAYHGVYDGSVQACARRSVERLTVSARELRFHESVGAVRSVGFGGSAAIAVEADYEGEGRRWRNLRILGLIDNGAKLTLKGEGASVVRVRCPAGAR